MFKDWLVGGVSRREIVDNHEKENALNIVTEDRTYQIYAESPEDARYISNLYLFYASVPDQ